MKDIERQEANAHMASVFRAQQILNGRFNQLLKENISGTFLKICTLTIFICTAIMITMEVLKPKYAWFFHTRPGIVASCIVGGLLITLVIANFRLNHGTGGFILAFGINAIVWTIYVLVTDSWGINRGLEKTEKGRIILIVQITTCAAIIITAVLIIYFFSKVLCCWRKRITRQLINEGAFNENEVNIMRQLNLDKQSYMKDLERHTGNEHLANMMRTQQIFYERMNQLLHESISPVRLQMVTLCICISSLGLTTLEVLKRYFAVVFITRPGIVAACLCVLLAIVLIIANFKLNLQVAGITWAVAVNALIWVIYVMSTNIYITTNIHLILFKRALGIMICEIILCCILIIVLFIMLIGIGRLIFGWRKRMVNLLVSEGALNQNEINSIGMTNFGTNWW
ncbi:hypothetical protein SNEBB_009588 [Seison nebaliae]|nr:hypothetical protein SNEBB_009588 [Seison nebaliae]